MRIITELTSLLSFNIYITLPLHHSYSSSLSLFTKKTLLIFPSICDFFSLSGERLIQYASENLVTEVLIHPQYNTLIQCMRNMLSSFTRHRHIIHAGYTFSSNGSWILQVFLSPN